MTTPEEGKNQQNADLDFHIRDFPKHFWAYIADVVDLKKGVNSQATIEDIKSKSSLAGANSWMLMCSIVIASIGLSQDNPAVIIGAMLISPLMSPILGIGMSIAINDMEALKDSLSQFSIAIIIAVLTSYIYFEVTPFNELTSEIAARTKPTFLDIFIGLFGGIAGIISTARKDISTTIPGVAIATALMPPLCVTGYGMASGDWEIASASFYLFFLNTFFVALSTYLIVRFLKFPTRKFIDKRVRRKNVLLVVAFSLALVIPSFMIFRSVLKELRLKKNLEAFKISCLEEGGRYLDDYSIVANKLVIRVYGDPVSQKEEDDFRSCLSAYGVNDYEIDIISTSEVSLIDVQLLDEKVQVIAGKLETYEQNISEQNREIQMLRNQSLDSILFLNLQEELKILYPKINRLGLAKVHSTDFNDITHNLPTVMINWNNRNKAQQRSDEDEIQKFLKARLNADSVQIISY